MMRQHLEWWGKNKKQEEKSPSLPSRDKRAGMVVVGHCSLD
jgi:hypothetical protein